MFAEEKNLLSNKLIMADVQKPVRSGTCKISAERNRDISENAAESNLKPSQMQTVKNHF